MKKLIILFTFLFILMSEGCSTVDPTNGRKFNVENKKQCIQVCKEAQMSFDALVVVGGMSGCVCGNRTSSKSSDIGGIMGGQVAALAAQAAAAAQTAQQQQRR